jgi:hypothetical protein
MNGNAQIVRACASATSRWSWATTANALSSSGRALSIISSLLSHLTMSCLPAYSGIYRARQISHDANAGALTLILKKSAAFACGAATSTSVTTPRSKLSTFQSSVPGHRKKFAQQHNRGWRGSISQSSRKSVCEKCNKDSEFLGLSVGAYTCFRDGNQADLQKGE